MPVDVIDINAEIERFFDDASLTADAQPVLVLFLGGTASGKTTIRQQQYGQGYVLLDAGTIFRNLTWPERLSFPDAGFELPVNAVGAAVAARAIRERRNIVVECIGTDAKAITAVIDALLGCRYKVRVQYVHCDPVEAWQRNLRRSHDDISAYFTESYHLRWLRDATQVSS